MMPRPCAVPACSRPATGIFCSEHYFALPSKEARWLVRLQILLARSDDEDTKLHLREQLHGYTCQAVRTIQNAEALSSSQAALDSARPSSSSRMAGATLFEVRHG